MHQFSDINEKYLTPLRLLSLLVVLLLISIVLASVTGAVSLSWQQWQQLLLGDPAVAHYHSIIVSIRLPRVLLAISVGAILGICGAAMQGLFRNPLADPSLIGVTAGASLGASMVIVVFAGWQQLSGVMGLSLVSVGAFTGGIVAVIAVYRLAHNAYGVSVATMLLAGIGITALSASITNIFEFYASNEMLRRLSLWRMGGLEGVSTPALVLAIFAACAMVLLLLPFAQSLNALLLGESEARYLGVDVDALKHRLIIVVAAGVGIAVALAGAIGFIGLVVPHIVRLLIGPDHRYLLPASALAGALLLVVSDVLARTLLAPTEIPVGIITAFVGVPFFISLLHRRHLYGMETS